MYAAFQKPKKEGRENKFLKKVNFFFKIPFAWITIFNNDINNRGCSTRLPLFIELIVCFGGQDLGLNLRSIC
jgi:hypothetical protein